MIEQAGRIDMQVKDGDLLLRTMHVRGYSLRTLAEKVSRTRIQGRKVSVSYGMIGHLTKDRRKCNPDLAVAICKVLDVPVDCLFTLRLSTVSREVEPKRKAAA